MLTFAGLISKLLRRGPVHIRADEDMPNDIFAPLVEALGPEEFARLCEPGAEFKPVVRPDQPFKNGRSSAFERAKIEALERRYVDCLKSCMIVLACDGVGRAQAKYVPGEDLQWTWRSIPPAHGVLKMAAKCMNSASVTLSDAEQMFFDQAVEVAGIGYGVGSSRTPSEMWSDILPPLSEHIESGTRWRPRLRS